MPTAPLWKLAIRTRPAAEETVAQLLERSFATPPCVYHDLKTGQTEVAVYLSAKPAAKEVNATLIPHLRQLALQTRTSVSQPRLLRIQAQNWQQSWKRHFKPLDIGSKLLLKPSWSRRKPKNGQAVIILDPGLSFGTGQHPTTAYCLEELVRHRAPARRQSVLDLGTGSGILALAAARLGYSPVEAIDFDPDAIRVARANARANRVEDRIRFFGRDLTRLPLSATRKFDVICANLLSTLLIEQRSRILARLTAGGRLVVAGILKTEFPGVAEAFAQRGLRLKRSRAAGEWRSGTFVFRAKKF